MSGLLSSCTIMRKVPVSPNYTSFFSGTKKAEIIRQIGVPDNEASDGNNGSIFEYTDGRKLQSSTEYFRRIQSKPYVKIEYVRRIAFFFDKDDKCYLVKTDAIDIQKQYSPGRTGALVGGLLGGIAFFILMIALSANSYQ